MVRLETPHVDIMSLEPAEILNPVRKVFALLEVASGVLVTLGPVPLQGEVDQGSAENGGREGMFCLQRCRSRRHGSTSAGASGCAPSTCGSRNGRACGS